MTIDRFAPYVKDIDTLARTRTALAEALGGAIVNRRLAQIANAPDSPILGGSASLTDYFDVAKQSSVTIAAKEGEWETALKIGEQEVRRALQYGFTDAEIAEQLANFSLFFRNAAEQEGTRRNAALAEQILASANDESLVIAPRTQLEVFERIKGDLTAEMVSQAFVDAFGGSQPLIHVTSKEPITSEDVILSAYSASQQIAVAPADRNRGQGVRL